MTSTIRRAFFALMTVGLCGIAAPSVAQANTTAGVEREMAVVRVTIQQDDGTVLRATKATAWGQVAQFELEGHDLDLSVTDRRHLGMHYAHEGSEVDKESVDVTPRSRVVVYADQDVKVTVQVIPVKVQVHGESAQ